MSGVPKASSVVTQDDEYINIKSNEHLNKWLCQVSEKLKTLNLIYNNTYCHQISQSDDVHP